MWIEAVKPLRVQFKHGKEVRLHPGAPVEFPDEDGQKLIEQAPGKVRLVLRPGDVVEWLSPALPRQQGEILAVHDDGTFEVWHPLTERLCRLPMTWVTKVLNSPLDSMKEPTS